ncbi:M23 family metallopeptidase [Amphibacillus indicireducens]|uniref:L-Ala--D-Glu endopeptidase n=1 Tax=Amphibacillus indicireducens TaxID=1076330 RepID=A0ABP7VIB6_9BACI
MIKIMLCFLIFFQLFAITNLASEELDLDTEREALYRKTEAISQVPWYYLAAIDQYERQIHQDKRSISITLPEHQWFGITNIDQYQSITAINLHHGIGKDGNGDGLADPDNPEDQLYTIADYLSSYGLNELNIQQALWDYYQRPLAVKTIKQNAKIYQTYRTTALDERAFPVPKHFNYSYRSTWGDARGFGGRRIHEGTDIFAGYGTPVRATTYGTIEIKGWNRYGGWRIGIRDLDNIYHYYAHLHGFEADLNVGDIVEPGQVIGYVGSTGYGPPGTSGKFPPHLHYGMYKDNGENQWAFDPFPSLKRAEQQK